MLACYQLMPLAMPNPTAERSAQPACGEVYALFVGTTLHGVRAFAAAICLLCFIMAGCTRTQYRLEADDDALNAISQKACDPRWPLENYSIYSDPRSRHFDPNDPDKEPMPPDDPAAHKLMHCIDCKRGSGCWHCNGDTPYVENPEWMQWLPRNERGEVVMDRAVAVDLALLHAPAYQREVEDLYLSALDVTFERFRFDVQFFARNETTFVADGPLRNGNGESSSTLTSSTDLEARKLFANGGELVVGLANSLVWQFSGEDSNFATSLLDFSLVQPLLRGGGRQRVLERLTISERTLLNNVRAMERYRRGFYVNVVTGREAGTGPARRGGVLGGAGLSGFTGVGFGQINTGTANQVANAAGAGGAGAGDAGGYLGLLQDQQQLRNQEATVAALEESLAELQAAFEAGRIDRFQVDLARQALYNTRSQLLTNRANYQAALDRFKITLGIPPNLNIKIDDPLLSPFQLIDPIIPPIQTSLTRLQETVGGQILSLRELAANNADDGEAYRNALVALHKSIDTAELVQHRTAEHFASVRADLARVERYLPARVEALKKLQEQGFSDPDSADEVIEKARDGVRDDGDLADGVAPRALGVPAAADRDEIGVIIDNLRALPDKLHSDLQSLANNFKQTPIDLGRLRQELQALEQSVGDRNNAAYRARLNAVLGQLPDRLVDLSGDVLELSLIQARARAESVTLLPIELESDDALVIASRNRLDWMNARTLLVDTWRLIEFTANDLLSTFNLLFSGDVRNVGDNPLNFNSTTGRLRVGFQFDAPLTRVAERNQYRQSLIEYQQARRDYYTFIDRVSQAVRGNLRQIDLDQANFELRRAAVRVAIDQVEITRLRLRQPPQPGVATTFGNTTARDLVSALADLQNVQNDFLSVWVNYEVERLQLDFNLGTMQIDTQGQWIDSGSAIGTTGIGLFQPDCGANGEWHSPGQQNLEWQESEWQDGGLWSSDAPAAKQSKPEVIPVPKKSSTEASDSVPGGWGLSIHRTMRLHAAEHESPPRFAGAIAGHSRDPQVRQATFDSAESHVEKSDVIRGSKSVDEPAVLRIRLSTP